MASFHHAITGQSLAIGAGVQVQSYTPRAYSTNPGEYPSNTGIPSSGGMLGCYIPSGYEQAKYSLAYRMYEQHRDGVVAGGTSGDFVSVAADGRSGNVYTAIKKGSVCYSEMMANVQYFYDDTAGVVEALHIIHGTSDTSKTVATYQGYLVEWRSDFDGDAKAITGQVADIPATMSQPWIRNDAQNAGLAKLAQWRANPTLFKLAGPRYGLPINPDSLPHVDAIGYYMLGEYHARALEPDFEPLAPTSVLRAGNVITVTFNAQSQLVWGVPPSAVAQSGTDYQTNYGFFYEDDDGVSAPSITDVSISGTNKVVVTLSGTPTGSNQYLGYVSQATTGFGNLRDSDTRVSQVDGTTPLYNWASVFYDPVVVPNRNNQSGAEPTAIAGSSGGNVLRGLTP